MNNGLPLGRRRCSTDNEKNLFSILVICHWNRSRHRENDRFLKNITTVSLQHVYCKLIVIWVSCAKAWYACSELMKQNTRLTKHATETWHLLLPALPYFQASMSPPPPQSLWHRPSRIRGSFVAFARLPPALDAISTLRHAPHQHQQIGNTLYTITSQHPPQPPPS